jgi:hypothetical protein
MKMTIDIPDHIFRKAKSRAAERGQTLKELVTGALQDKLGEINRTGRSEEPAWMQGFGELSRLHKETRRIQARIDEVFGVVEAEDEV